MNIFKPTKWNVAGLVIGLLSGYIIAAQIFVDDQYLFFYGLFFGIFSSLILLPQLVRSGMIAWRIALWEISWLIISGFSWYAAFWTFFFMASGELDIDWLPGSVIVGVASTVGVTILFLGLISVIHRQHWNHYGYFVFVTLIVSAASYWLAGGEFDGLLDGNLDLIHPLWQGAVLYMTTSLIAQRTHTPPSEET